MHVGNVFGVYFIANRNEVIEISLNENILNSVNRHNMYISFTVFFFKFSSIFSLVSPEPSSLSLLNWLPHTHILEILFNLENCFENKFCASLLVSTFQFLFSAQYCRKLSGFLSIFAEYRIDDKQSEYIYTDSANTIQLTQIGLVGYFVYWKKFRIFVLSLFFIFQS